MTILEKLLTPQPLEFWDAIEALGQLGFDLPPGFNYKKLRHIGFGLWVMPRD